MGIVQETTGQSIIFNVFYKKIFLFWIYIGDAAFSFLILHLTTVYALIFKKFFFPFKELIKTIKEKDKKK